MNGDARNAIVSSRFAPISMVELELKRRTALDGGSSVASDNEDGPDRAKRKRRRSQQSSNEKEDGDEVQAGSDVDDLGIETDGEPTEENVRANEVMLARAAFGGMSAGGSGGARKAARRDKDCTTLTSAASDSEDALSMTSSAVRKAHKAAFPISGVHCVGCALSHKVGLIDEFVKSSAAKMAETALYKMAALVYQRDIVEPAIKEGVTVPDWSWKDIHAHYTLHYVDPRLQRMENVRSLAAMRKTIELSMLREDETTGERYLDKANSEQLMKIVALQSKEIQLLENSSQTRNADKTPSRNRGRDD